MGRYCVFIITFLSFLFPIEVFAVGVDALNHTTWTYDRISSTDVFGKHDSKVIKNIEESQKKVSISFYDKKLIVKNKFLADGNVCSIDYVKIKKTPLSYYMSQSTVDLYKRLYNKNGHSLTDNLYYLTSVLPGQECPGSFKEILGESDYLAIQDRNYIVFFKKTDLDKDTETTKKKNWDTYCHEVKSSHEFDGTNRYSCFFSGMDLKKAYLKLISIHHNSDFFRKELPASNEEDKVGSKLISYHWDDSHELKVSIISDSESETYTFTEKPLETDLDVLVESQY